MANDGQPHINTCPSEHSTIQSCQELPPCLSLIAHEKLQNLVDGNPDVNNDCVYIMEAMLMRDKLYTKKDGQRKLVVPFLNTTSSYC